MHKCTLKHFEFFIEKNLTLSGVTSSGKFIKDKGKRGKKEERFYRREISHKCIRSIEFLRWYDYCLVE